MHAGHTFSARLFFQLQSRRIGNDQFLHGFRNGHHLINSGATCISCSITLLAAYRAQEWDKAEAALPLLQRELNALQIDLGAYITLYKTRISDLRQTPPGADWDGVYASTKK